MEQYKATATLFLDTRKAKSNGMYPLKLTVYYNGDKKRYKTNIDISKEEWKKMNTPRLKDDGIKERKIKVQLILRKAEKAIDEVVPFSFSVFEDVFYSKNKVKFETDIGYWFESYMDKLKAEGREGTRSSYQTTLNSLLRYKPHIKLNDVTKVFLSGYELQMKAQGKSPSTIGIYLRTLRAILNQAIAAGALKPEHYPFKAFEIPTARNVKKALNDESIMLLLNYRPSKYSQKKALAFWLFSYLCNGINMTDIAHLQPANVNETFLHYVRQKTIRTKKKDSRPIKVALHPRAKEIIEEWKTSDSNNPFLFPILEANLSPRNIKNRIQRFIKRVNAALEEIRVELNITQKIRTYEARHSHASVLMRRGASLALIKENLGHSNIAVTESYLGDFEDETKIKFTNLLTSFD